MMRPSSNIRKSSEPLAQGMQILGFSVLVLPGVFRALVREMGRKDPGTLAKGRVVIGSKQCTNGMGRRHVCRGPTVATRYCMSCN